MRKGRKWLPAVLSVTMVLQPFAGIGSVTAMAAEGRVQFLFHQEARDQKTLTSLYGAGTSQFCQSNPSPKLRLSVSNFNMLVEGYEFELTVTGEIKCKEDRPG